MQPAEHASPLSAEQELHVALETINAFSGWVLNGDTKIATLSTAQVVLAVFMAAQPISRAWPVNSPPSAIALIALIVFAVSFLATIRHLGAALRPRLSTGPGLNHFVFPSVARVSTKALGDKSAASLLDQAWAQAHTLSVIAVTRYRHFSRALTWVGLSVLSALVWLLVAGQIP